MAQRCILLDRRVKHPSTNHEGNKGVFHMRHPVAATRKAAQHGTSRSGTARRILQQVLGIDRAAIDESGTLADFEGCTLPNVAQPLTALGWRTRVKDRVFSCFGVDCDVDEPLSALVARIELAEHGVHCTLTH